MDNITQRIAEELSVKFQQVAATIQLLDEGATVPFIARYRKEATGGLDDTQLRTLHERLIYLRELEERRQVILKSIDEQGKLTDELAELIRAADNKTRLEDLYLPYKPKRRTKAQLAREAGLAPLAETLLHDPTQSPDILAKEYLNTEHNITDTKTALEGARHILMEQFAEDAELLAELRDYVWNNTQLTAQVIADKEEIGAKFADYFAFAEPIRQIPSHRALALFRGRNEGILQTSLKITEQENVTTHPCETKIATRFNICQQNRPADNWLQETVRFAWRIKIFTHLEIELLTQLRESAEETAIKVFANNLRDLLLAAPAGSYNTMGLDPGLRTGVKVAIVDNTGKLLDHTAIYPHVPQNQWQNSLKTLATLCQKHHVRLISIGNGTASRETDKLAAELIKNNPELGLQKIVISEAGASVYSASALAAAEFPTLDVSFRGAVSIARRLQDPLAELVKIEPKAIGVGQYQHDVNQSKLARTLDAVVEDCVNAVGVDLNTASVSLLARVSGLNQTLANNIVAFRDEHGKFNTREMLKKIPRLGDKTYQQAAGFLRIVNGSNPLDASAVHPEAYPVIECILEKNQKTIKDIIGNKEFLKNLSAQDYANEKFGIPTITDIFAELEKPGRDPRPEFKTANFKEDIATLNDLKVGMILEGAVTNVTNFGAFVDIGVHHDGLVHISELSHHYIKDPRDLIKAGNIIKVKVLEVDLKRQRVGLSMRLENKPTSTQSKQKIEPQKKAKAAPIPAPTSIFGNALAEALSKK